MKNTYTIIIFTENTIGMMNRISIIFTRRHLNIDSITTSESQEPGVYRYTIVLNTSQEQVVKLINQIQKQIDVLKVSYHEEKDIVHQEIALYKIKTETLTSGDVENVIRENHARILTVDPEFMVVEKTGHKEETQELFYKLEPYGVLEFVRSGRIAITKNEEELRTYIKELEK